MKKILLILASLISLCVAVQAQSNKETAKTINGQTTTEGILKPSNQIQPLAPTSGLDPVLTQNQTETPTRLVKGSPSSTLPKSTPWTALTVTEQINLITQEIAELRESQTNSLRLEKLEKLLEKKKLQNSLQVAP